MRDQLQAIRRRLWILSATLEYLPAKIELAYRARIEVAGRDGTDHSRPISDQPSDGPPVVKAPAALRGWLARWKLARLRARADRAERRAAAAIGDASASFAQALQAVLLAAIARVKADETDLAYLPPSPHS